MPQLRSPAPRRVSPAPTLLYSKIHTAMAAITFHLNGKPQTVDIAPQMPLLWVLRDTLHLTGTKYGCGIAACGACTVHVDGHPTRACVTPAASIAGKKVTTIEGLSPNVSHPVQRAWIENDVPQCGYC